MSKKWALIIFIFVLVVFGGVTLTYFYFSDEEKADESFYKNNPTPTTIAIPNELSKDFDPTVNSPVFSISDADSNRKFLRLIVIFPEMFILEEIDSEIGCENEDIKILKGEIEIATGLDAFFRALNDNSKETMVLSGICGDQNCRRITKQCNLYIHKN